MKPARPSSGPIDRILRWALIASFLTAALAMGWRVVEHRFGGPTEYQVGDTFAPLADVTFSASAVTLVVHVHSGCRFCTDSMPFLGDLTRMPRRGRIVMLGVQSSGVLRQYATRHGVSPDRIVSIPGESIPKLLSTPTMLLVDSTGVIRSVWRGSVNDPADRTRIAHALQ